MARIVIVDDEAEWRGAYRECLADAGHAAVAFENGYDALKHIATHGCDLVVLDVRMSPSGREVLRSIRGSLPGLPVIVASSHAASRNDPEFQDIAAFLDKSPRISELLHVVQEVLTRDAQP